MLQKQIRKECIHIGKCNLDHSQQDVLNKLTDQENFLSIDLVKELTTFIQNQPTQEQLNEIFHLLKKYDLASEIEQTDRNKKLALFTI